MHSTQAQSPRPSLARYAALSMAGALCTIALKLGAYQLSGSVGLLSDALESVVNLVAASLALAMLLVAARPADAGHPYGHDKAEYFAIGVEGALIVIAAVLILLSAARQWLDPQPLAQWGVGMAMAVVASVLNFLIARVLLQAARRHDSATLEADARHLLTDVWTTAGVLAGVAAVVLTGWLWLDALVATVVALHILRTGWRLLREAVGGLMDAALPAHEVAVIEAVLAGYRGQGVRYHDLRTRRAASRRFVSLHVLVPGAWTVQQGHDLLERIEQEIAARLDHVLVVSHLEPLEDPASWDPADENRPRPR